ncbi:MAG TPA: hypothetical protein VGL78_19215 [Solirubrobacteraceae bacterium]|jgi:hypothetical protein
MSFYVRRRDIETGRLGWTGPIRSERQAEREVAAWESCGWTAEKLPSTPEVRADVRAWDREVEERRNPPAPTGVLGGLGGVL